MEVAKIVSDKIQFLQLLIIIITSTKFYQFWTLFHAAAKNRGISQYLNDVITSAFKSIRKIKLERWIMYITQ